MKVELCKPMLKSTIRKEEHDTDLIYEENIFSNVNQVSLGFLFWMFQITFDSILNSRIKNTKFINVPFKNLHCIQVYLTLCMKYIYN